MARDISALQKLLAPSIEALGYELWGCVYIVRGRYGVLRIYIDSPKGINLADCERVSHRVSAILDVEDVISGAYTLEVSSPGLDRPLFDRSHYQRFIGSKVLIKLHDSLEGRKQMKGILREVLADSIKLELISPLGRLVEIPIAAIARANLSPELQKLGEKNR